MKHYKLNNEIYAFESDGSQDDLIIAAMVPITDADLVTLRNQQEQSRLDALTYSEKRASAYPSIADQLDTIYHDGLDAWKLQVQAVKDLHPK
tara:strand:+ start:156 stop:431 length:276 start_codon:yes stop_codon:yes gene_type:complete